jgi:hypothetical protein
VKSIVGMEKSSNNSKCGALFPEGTQKHTFHSLEGFGCGVVENGKAQVDVKTSDCSFIKATGNISQLDV